MAAIVIKQTRLLLRNILLESLNQALPTLCCIILLKFVYSEKATKFCEISTLLLSTLHTDKSKVNISQNFVAFLEYMNFKEKNGKK